MENEKNFRVSTSPATTFNDSADGGEDDFEESWSSYVSNGDLDHEMAMELQAELGPIDYPIMREYILRRVALEKAEEVDDAA